MARVELRNGEFMEVTAEKLQRMLQIKDIRKQVKTYKYL